MRNFCRWSFILPSPPTGLLLPPVAPRHRRICNPGDNSAMLNQSGHHLMFDPIKSYTAGFFKHCVNICLACFVSFSPHCGSVLKSWQKFLSSLRGCTYTSKLLKLNGRAVERAAHLWLAERSSLYIKSLLNPDWLEATASWRLLCPASSCLASVCRRLQTEK